MVFSFIFRITILPPPKLFFFIQQTMADLTEEDVPRAKLYVSVPALQKQKCSDLMFWRNCRGDSCEGLKTKAQMIERYFQVG